MEDSDSGGFGGTRWRVDGWVRLAGWRAGKGEAGEPGPQAWLTARAVPSLPQCFPGSTFLSTPPPRALSCLSCPAHHPADVSFSSAELAGRKRKRGADDSDGEVQLEDFEKREIMRVGGWVAGWLAGWVANGWAGGRVGRCACACAW